MTLRRRTLLRVVTRCVTSMLRRPPDLPPEAEAASGSGSSAVACSHTQRIRGRGEPACQKRQPRGTARVALSDEVSRVGNTLPGSSSSSSTAMAALQAVGQTSVRDSTRFETSTLRRPPDLPPEAAAEPGPGSSAVSCSHTQRITGRGDPSLSGEAFSARAILD